MSLKKALVTVALRMYAGDVGKGIACTVKIDEN